MKNSQHFMIRQNIAGASSFTQDIFIRFTPTRLKVHYCYYLNDLEESGMSLLRTNILSADERYLVAFSDGAIVGPTEFMITKPIQGQYTFEITDIFGLLDNTRAGKIAIDLEFIE